MNAIKLVKKFSAELVYLCPMCGEPFLYQHNTKNCCQPDEWMCSKCKCVYIDEEQAEYCCSEEHKADERQRDLDEKDMPGGF